MNWVAPGALAALGASAATLIQFNYVDGNLLALFLTLLQQNYIAVAISLIAIASFFLRSSRPAPVLLRDFVCYQPDSSLKVSVL
jgi:hypothetical protein